MKTNAEQYAALRRSGVAYVQYEDRGTITGIKALAKKDGLQIVQCLHGKPRHHNRHYTLNLVHPSSPTLIFVPDANQEN